MVNLEEVLRRAEAGPEVAQDDFDLDRVYGVAKEVCRRYGIVYDPKTVVPSDDDLADRVYEAAVDFFCAVGVYCTDTHRVIKFSRAEVLAAVAGSQGRAVLGEGRERREFLPRRPDSGVQPWIHVGTGFPVTSERVLYNMVRAYSDFPQTNSISCPALVNVDGHAVEAGSPWEIIGAIRSIQAARAAMRDAGRPGLAIGNCVSTAGSAMGTLAASGEQFGLRRSDGWLLGALAEMKVNMGVLSKAAYFQAWGANICGESGLLVGGYAGGPATSAVANTAYIFLGMLALGCNYHLAFPLHLLRRCSSVQEALWTSAVSAQATSRNTREPVWYLAYMTGGPLTGMFHYQTAAFVATVVSSGVSAQAPAPARGVRNDYVTPLDRLGYIELSQACAGMKRSEANEVVKALLPKYMDAVSNPPPGTPYQEAYDMETGMPSQKAVDFYGGIKEELRGLGFRYRS